MKKYLKYSLKQTLILALLLFTNHIFAQTVPNISYVNPSGYRVGNQIAPLAPTTTGTVSITGETSDFAGSGLAGSANGAPANASFNKPLAIAQDAQNNLYVADFQTHIIRKITATGTVSTIAGTPGVSGTADGAGTTVARFNQPRGLAVDASGNIYVADYGNNLIRKINGAGVVTTIAGNPMPGYADGTGSSASFNGPMALAIDGSGNLLVSDYSNHVIRKVTPAGVVTTFAGQALTTGNTDGSLTAARFNHPYGIGLDQSGNIYIADRTNCRIRKISTSGVVSTLAGNIPGFFDQSGNAAKFNNPCGLSLDQAGNIYVADNLNQRIRKVTQAGVVTTLAGTGVSGYRDTTGNASLFENPFAVLADNEGGFVYVGDYNNRIRKVALAPYTISPDLPAGLVFDTGNGVISGSPDISLAATTFTVNAYNNAGIDTATINISVSAAYPISLSDQNYIVTYTPRIDGITTNTAIYSNAINKTHVATVVTYFDGLGRQMQSVQIKGSPGGSDLVQPFAYDSFGREVVKYLPYPDVTTNYGKFKTGALVAQQAFYSSSTNAGIVKIDSANSKTVFEPSPLDRVLEQGGPGIPWQPGNHTVKTDYTTNNTVALSDTGATMLVALYKAIPNSDFSNTLTRSSGAAGNYSAGQLFVTVVKDENNTGGRRGNSEEYKDLEGHVVLKRHYNYSGNILQILSTYYIYDIYGNLVFVLPPGANPDHIGLPSSSVLDNLCYQYQYDNRNRMIAKKVPGRGWDYIIYNKLDQVIATQDSVQRMKSPQQVSFTKYDALGREIETGYYSLTGSTPGTNNRVSIQNSADAQTTLWETRTASTTHGYSNSTLPVSGITLLTVNYYDNNNDIPNIPANYSPSLPASSMTNSLLTAKKVAVLNNPTDFLWSVNYYDDRGRLLDAFKQHYYGGHAYYNSSKFDEITYVYDFTNQIIATNRYHYNNSFTPILTLTVANTYTYDHIGRKKQAYESLNSGVNVVVNQLDYNLVGQLTTKHLHSLNDGAKFMQNISYTYNERGWISKISSPLFENQLQYNSVQNIAGISPAAQYNGNIASQSWGTSTSPNTSSYTYTYDNLNRLISGISTNGYNERKMVYDSVGNIKSLQRDSASIHVDSLSYNYLSSSNKPTNQLYHISDATTSNSGLTHGSNFAYTYDGNGNMLSNSNRNISLITYNLLNLPQTFTVPGGVITYIYDANGNKLGKSSTQGAGYANYYADGIQYNDTTLNFIETDEGRAIHNGSSYNYQYSITDYSGNSRISFDIYNGNTRTLQRDDYYPFGKEINYLWPSNKNEYLYNEKELQEETGIYDYGARFYDPLLARWTTIDPLSEKSRRWSPYNYVENNPIRNIDPDGMGSYGESDEDMIKFSGPGDIFIKYYSYTDNTAPPANPTAPVTEPKEKEPEASASAASDDAEEKKERFGVTTTHRITSTTKTIVTDYYIITATNFTQTVVGEEGSISTENSNYVNGELEGTDHTLGPLGVTSKQDIFFTHTVGNTTTTEILGNKDLTVEVSTLKNGVSTGISTVYTPKVRSGFFALTRAFYQNFNHILNTIAPNGNHPFHLFPPSGTPGPIPIPGFAF